VQLNYLANLTLRLATGIARLPEETRSRHAAWLAAVQAEDGGFPGRQGPSDLYYTGFGLRALALLGRLEAEPARRAAGYLRDHLALADKLRSVDFLSLVSSAVLVEMTAGIDAFAAARVDRRALVATYLDRLRCEDGGCAKTAQGPHSSTYHTFLAASCRQLVDLPIADPERIERLIRSRQRDDGGFVELAPLRQSGANPTAAAVALLEMLGVLDNPTRRQAAAFLARMQSAEGGLRANGRIPVADLLSTFTGLVALADLGASDAVDPAAIDRYARSLEDPRGGFRGGAWDDTADVEYTFYGLGTLALVVAGTLRVPSA